MNDPFARDLESHLSEYGQSVVIEVYSMTTGGLSTTRTLSASYNVQALVRQMTELKDGKAYRSRLFAIRYEDVPDTIVSNSTTIVDGTVRFRVIDYRYSYGLNGRPIAHMFTGVSE